MPRGAGVLHMANPADITRRGESRGVEGLLYTVVQELNKVTTNLRVLTAKLDADAGVTDTNYGTLVTDSAASGPAKITLTNG